MIIHLSIALIAVVTSLFLIFTFSAFLFKIDKKSIFVVSKVKVIYSNEAPTFLYRASFKCIRDCLLMQLVINVYNHIRLKKFKPEWKATRY